MDPNSPTPKRSILKKVIYILLIVIPILILLETSIGMIIGVKGINFLSYQRLLEQRGQITTLVFNILRLSVLEPGEKFYYLQSKSDLPIDMTVIAQDCPETVGIYRLNTDGTTTNYLQHFPSIEIQNRIIEAAPTLMDELNFIKTYWNPNWKFDHQSVEFDDNTYLYTYLQNDTDTYIIVTDLEKLKIRLPDIFERRQKQFAVFAKYFLPLPQYGAQIKFFDQNGSNFFTLGTPQGTSWDDIWEGDFNNFPWTWSVQLFSKNETLVQSASVKDSTPWGFVIQLIIGIACIIILPWYARKY
jgi:hypothetical protein